MEFQEIIALVFGILALLFVIKKLVLQFIRPGSDPKCEKCIESHNRFSRK